MRLRAQGKISRKIIPLIDENRLITEIRAITGALPEAGLAVKHHWHASDSTAPASHQCREQSRFIDASQTMLELGHPTTASIFLGILTHADNRVENNRITRFGKNLSELPPGRHALALILFAKVPETSENARRDLNKHILSCNRLDGVMARMASGRIWFRFSQQALARGLTLDAIGSHILARMQADHHRYETTEIMFVVGDRDHIERLRPLAEKQARARSDHYQRVLTEKMTCETGLDCDQCPETETCSVLRQAVAAAHKKAGG